MNEIELFKKRCKEIIEGKGLKVEYFGSTKDSVEWKKGKSDLDIFVFGNMKMFLSNTDSYIHRFAWKKISKRTYRRGNHRAFHRKC